MILDLGEGASFILREYILVAVAALAAYAGAAGGVFHFDDFSIFADPAITSSSGWYEVWQPMQTRPLTWFTFWLNHALGGDNPLGYHLFNFLAHLATALLLRLALWRLMPGPVGFMAALLFAVHPMASETVCYVFARSSLLATFFCVGALDAWGRKRHWEAAAWFAAALLAKEECAAFPIFLLALHVSVSRDKRELPAIQAMTAMAALAGLRVIYGLRFIGEGGGPYRAGIHPLDYFAMQGLMIPRYLARLIVPVNFSIDPDFPLALAPWGWLGWAAICGLVYLAYSRFDRAREGFWFIGGLILLLPGSSVFPVADLSADRRMYLPMIAFSVAAAFLFQRVSKIAFAAIVVLLAGLSIERTIVWRSGETLWAEAMNAAPDKLRPKIQLARALPPDAAIKLLNEAKKTNPDEPLVASELGRAYVAAGRASDALPEFGRALALRPNDARALSNRGAALLALGHKDTAKPDFEQALRADPCLFEARYQLRAMGVATEPRPGCNYTGEQRRLLEDSAATPPQSGLDSGGFRGNRKPR